MVSALRALGVARLSEAAKRVEHGLALAGFLAAGAAAGALVFTALRARVRRAFVRAGAASGVLAFSPLVLPAQVSGDAAHPLLAAAWILALGAAWGGALGYAFRRGREGGVVEAGGSGAIAQAMDRRTFIIRAGGAAATLTVAGAWVARELAVQREREAVSGTPWSAAHSLPNAGSAVEPVPGTRGEITPVGRHYRIDIDSLAPALREETWRLRLGGMVANPREWTLAELRRNYAPVHRFITLACISNPVGGDLIGTQRWTGVPLRDLLREARPRAGAARLAIRAADGFHESLSLEEAMEDDGILLAYAWDGLPLTREHGFPLRIHIPDRYGMKQPKWIVSLEAVARAEPGYWVARGWDREARVRATSVIDTVGTGAPKQADGEGRVPIGGIAYAGARGISKVEISADGGPWREAELRAPLSGETWVIWRYAWPFAAGAHTLAVRCFDGSGAAQIAEPSPPHPAGAAGLDRREARLRA
jgi:DMSO/TMAO reductase YedYZ molybdopterin-dependent catalytic subunit